MQRELFRAKEVNADNWIVSDSIEWDNDRLYLLNEKFEQVECEPETRSVSYPNMIDKNGKKIFASLGEDGVGGDELYHEDGCEIFVAEYTTKGMRLYEYLDNKVIKNAVATYRQSFDFEVIGIHKGE